ncbi:MAG TPA: NIPSNAP family protein [Vineibacter sp.]|nr:NIPSNAP family protein [Vineibacter sp.]
MIYELRTYNVKPEAAADVVALYQAEGWPELQKWQQNLVGYFFTDIGPLHQIVHLWKFENHEARDHQWTTLRANAAFAQFGRKIRPMLQSQENKILKSAPWGPTP